METVTCDTSHYWYTGHAVEEADPQLVTDVILDVVKEAQ